MVEHIHGCDRCQARGWPDRFGSRPSCAFEEQWFSHENWQCVTLGILRDIADEHGFSLRSDDNDGSLAVIPTDDRGYIVLSFYKNRGSVGQAVVMNDDEPPRSLLLEDAEVAIYRWRGEGA